MELRRAALAAFTACQPLEKVHAVQALWAQEATASVDPSIHYAQDPSPGRPDSPVLLEPDAVPRRSPFTPEGHAALMHAIAHIEFNAINLALDAVWRFADMPGPYYRDWLQVAAEESQHFMLLHAHLHTLGYAYVTLARTTACGRSATTPAMMCWPAWPWCRAPWRRGGWTRPR